MQDIISHSHLIQKWKDALEKNALHPVQLLCGSEGGETLALARYFAQYILCENREHLQGNLFIHENETAPSKERVSCGKCGACTRVEAHTHPDLHFFYPVINNPKEGLKLSIDYRPRWQAFLKEHPYGNIFDWLAFTDSSNKQPNISTEECKLFISSLSQKPYEGKYKVYIFWLPEFLGKDANRLLKVLEEPMENTYLFFVTQNLSALLPTFMSRCLTLSICLPSDIEIEQYLKKKFASEMDEHRRAYLIRYCKGDLRKLHQALHKNNDKNDEHLQQISELFNALLVEGPVAQMKWIDKMGNYSRTEVEHFFIFFSHTMQQISQYIPSGFKEEVKIPLMEQCIAQIQKTSIHQSWELIEEICNKSIWAIRRNVNIKMELHNFIIELHTILRDHKFYHPLYIK